LLGFLRRSSTQLSISEVLAQLGIDLAEGERPAGMWIGRVDGVDGYVVVTDMRLLVVEGARRPTRSFPAPEYPLSGLVRAEIVRHHRETRLVVEWRHADSTVISKLSAKDLARVYSTLTGQSDSAEPRA
jgi:hypothetical protein